MSSADPARAPVELQSYLTLPPGNYELRAAIMNTGTQAAASVFTHIAVPPFDDSRLSLSDLVLGTRQNAGALPEAAPGVPIVPTAARAFHAGDAVWAFLRVYPAAAKATVVPVSVDITIANASGQTVHQQTETVAAGGDVLAALPLGTLPPGAYVLRMNARQGAAAAARAIGFRVEP